MVTCTNCSGEGRSPDGYVCPECKGSGETPGPAKYSVAAFRSPNIVGEYETIEAARREAGRVLGLEPGEEFCVFTCHRFKPRIDGQKVIEWIDEDHAEETGAEYSWPHATKEQIEDLGEKLTRAFMEWLEDIGEAAPTYHRFLKWARTPGEEDQDRRRGYTTKEIIDGLNQCVEDVLDRQSWDKPRLEGEDQRNDHR